MSARHRWFSLVAVSAVLATVIASRADVVRTTLYLHSLSPVSNVEEAPSLAGGGETEPSMDATPPATPAPKAAVAGPGNPNFRKNPLVGWWSAPIHGRVSNASVTLYLGPNAQGTVGVTLFGDGGVGTGGVIGHAEATPGRAPATIELEIPVDASVNEELVLSVDMGLEGGTLLYDSTLAPSALSFDLGPYVAPPPYEPPAAADGFGPFTPVNLLKAQRETSLAVDPADADLMTMCDPSGVPALGEGHSYYSITRDGGATWAELDNEPDPNDSRRYAFEGGDCDVAFDAAGTMYTADTWLGNLSVGASRDGGATWIGTPLAVTSPIVDRPWLVGGAAGVVHLTYQDVQALMPTAIWYARSNDYGQTFSPAVPVATADVNGAFSWQGNFVVRGSDLYCVYTKRTGPVLSDLDSAGPETVWVAASHDGGATWTQHTVAATPNPASYLYPSIAMDAGGMLHVVYASLTADDRPVWYTTSVDGAETWTTPAPLMTGVSGFSPWVDAGAPGEAVIQWYGSPNPKAALDTDQDWYVYWARVTDAGTPSQAITSGTTTTEPIFHGKQSETPEFNQVRLGPDGKMRFGISAMHTDASGGVGWATFYQEEQ